MNAVPAWTRSSPWLDPKKPNLFRDEIQFAQANDDHPLFKAHPLFTWITNHEGEQRLFEALARLAPMFPVIAYHGQVAIWTSPPPSGAGNTIFLVLGIDKTDRFRIVGGNYFTEPEPHPYAPHTSVGFFNEFDQATTHRQQQLIKEAIFGSITRHEMNLLRSISQQCEHFHTMGVYIVALTSEGGLFFAAPVMLEGDRPADFSYEFFGEIA